MVSAALINHIAHVVELGAKEEMIDTNTFRVVTAMQDGKAVRDWPSLTLPGISVSRMLSFVVSDKPVSSICAMADPIPARLSLINLLPESIIDRSESHGSFAGLGAVDSLSKTSNRKISIEHKFFSAMRAVPSFFSFFVAFEFTSIAAKVLTSRASSIFNRVGPACITFVMKWHGGILLQPGRNVNQASAIA